MNLKKRITHVKACSEHLNSLGYNTQCVDEFNGVVYLLGTDGNGFHLHQLYKARGKGSPERRKRIETAIIQYTEAFNLKDVEYL